MDEGFLIEDVLDAAFTISNLKNRQVQQRWQVINAVRRRARMEYWRVPVEVTMADLPMGRNAAELLIGDDSKDRNGKPKPDFEQKLGRMWRVEWILQRIPPVANKRPAFFWPQHPAYWRNWDWTVEDRAVRAALLGISLEALIRASEGELDARNEGGNSKPRVSDARFMRQIARPFFLGLDRIADPGEQPRVQVTLGRAKTRGKRASEHDTSSKGLSDENSSSPKDREKKSKNGDVVLDGLLAEAYTVVRSAIWRRTRTDVDDGTALAKQLARIVMRVPLEQLLRGVETAPDGHKAPLVVKHLQKIADGRTELLDEADLREDVTRPGFDYEQAIETRIRYIRALEDDGGEVPEVLREELAAWQAEGVRTEEEG